MEWSYGYFISLKPIYLSSIYSGFDQVEYIFYIEFWVRSSFECENFQAKTQNVLKCNCTIYDMAMGIRWKIQNRLTVVEESNHNIFGSHYYSQNCRMWLTREKYILTFIDTWKKFTPQWNQHYWSLFPWHLDQYNASVMIGNCLHLSCKQTAEYRRII